MSRPASALNVGQTNKKFLYLALVLGALGALLVYVAFSRSGGSGHSGSGDQVPVVVAKTDIEARAKVTASMVEVKLVPASDASSLAFTDTAKVIGQVTRFPIAANEQILSTKVIDLSGTGTGTTSVAGKSLSYVIPPGMRAIAVNVKDVTNAGGLVLPGDFVDVIVDYDIDFINGSAGSTSHDKVDNYFVQTLLQNKQVLAVKQTIVDGVQPVGTPGPNPANSGQVVRNSEANPQPDAQTVTLALSPEDAQKLYFAEMNGHIRFAVRPYGDNEEKPIDPMIQSDLFPRNLPNPFVR